MRTPTSAVPTILFGAFDRHNLGDLLFPHIAARLLANRTLLFAGLVERDLRSVGGHHTRSISQLAAELAGQPVNLLHAGGELLTCDAWQAAVMVQPVEQVQPLIQRLERDEEARRGWLHDVLGNNGQAPYTIARGRFPNAVSLLYTAVGGVELKEREASFLAEVVAKLKEADYLSVRDQQTWANLKALGITCRLAPDPVVMIAELFGDSIEQYARQGEAAEMQRAFPEGYVACQFSADFGDDATLRQLAAQLDRLAEGGGHGIVLFRAGAAPWHDDLECYRRLAGFMISPRVKIFSSLDIWDICALLARSRGYCGSSLHGRIITMAYGLPRININHPHQQRRSGKQAAYAATWELPGYPGVVELNEIATGWELAKPYANKQLHLHASALADRYRKEFATIETLLDAQTTRA